MLQIIAGLFQRISEKILGLFRKKFRTDKELAELLEVAYIRYPDDSGINTLISALIVAGSINAQEYQRLHAMYEHALKGKRSFLEYYKQYDSIGYELRRYWCWRFINRMIYIETMKELGYAYE